MKETSYCTEDERLQILVEWNDTHVDFPEEACLHDLFAERVAEAPEALAVQCGDESLTYGELDVRANQVANYLVGLGTGPESIVAIAVERSLEMVVGLLGILKAGAAYLPMDPVYPRERLEYMASDADIGVILTLSHLADSLPGHGARVVRLDGDRAALDRESTTAPDTGVTSANLCYVIYTSGSTGAPKGVLLDHLGRVNNFLDFNRRFSIGKGDRLIGLASLSFDMCAYDVFGTLAAGAAIIFPRQSEMQDPVAWAQLIKEQGVTIWHTAPALLQMLVEHGESQRVSQLDSLRLVLLGGDWIPVSLPDRLRSLSGETTVVSMGGATECSMDSTIYIIGDIDPNWTSIPYGKPMANQRAYVLDEGLEPVAVGATGELFLGGVGVARGYFNRDELTAERFLPDPFWGIEGARMYRTGDLARWMPDGNLQLLGRIDHQVKIRGHRIELGEIEARINEHPAVQEGIVSAFDDKTGSKRLVAYIVLNPDWTGSEEGASTLGTDQVQQWQEVYENAYSKDSPSEDPTFNIISWDSSYTGKQMPAGQMRVWVDQTVERIMSHSPERVLEIGCGMGLLLFRIAPSCKSYCGTDFSAVALDHVGTHIERLGLDQVKLESRWADDFTGIEDNSLDAIVLNSIVLDFPGSPYLQTVLTGSARAVAPGGTIFVGDVRDHGLLEAFQVSVQIYKANPDLPTEELRGQIRNKVFQEEELTVHPQFFYECVNEIPAICGVRIQLKRGSFTNELTAFRYDATLFVGEGFTTPHGEVQVIDWTAGSSLLQDIETALEEEPYRLVLVHGILNSRVIDDIRTIALLGSADCPPTAGLVREQVAAMALQEPGVDPEDLALLGERLGVEVELRPAADPSSGHMDVALLRIREGEQAPSTLFPQQPVADRRPEILRSLANNPLRGKHSRLMWPSLLSHLEKSLPEHMLPSYSVCLEAFPLSPNGKIDRKALPSPDMSRPGISTELTEPESDLEKVIALIWMEVLGMDRVGMHDSFLALGGHSLLAVQVRARLSEIFPARMKLEDLIESATPSTLTSRIRAMNANKAINADMIAGKALAIKALSPEEVTERLRTKDLTGL